MNFAEFKIRYEHTPVEEVQHQVPDFPIVSVCVQTYQHAPYIRECLDSILSQQTTFPFEILVGDDGSTDGTREICLDYAQRFPEKIRLFLHHRANNIKINGVPTGRFNFVYNLFSARGKYIALCEGDDYWTDVTKLQKQVTMLDNHADYVLCHHWQELTVQQADGTFYLKPAPEEGHGYYSVEVASVAEVFANKLRVKTRTLMFRNIDLDFPLWFFSVAFGDVSISMLLGKYGSFGFLNEKMAVYRITGTGASSFGSTDKMFFLNHYVQWIRIWEHGNTHHQGRYAKAAHETIIYFYVLILKRYKGSWSIYKRLIIDCLVVGSSTLSNKLKFGFYLTSEFIRINIQKRWK